MGKLWFTICCSDKTVHHGIYIYKQLNSCGVVLIVLNVGWMSMKLWDCLCYIPVFLPLGMLEARLNFISSLHTKVLLVCSTTEIAAAKWCRFSTWIFLCCRNLRRSVFTVLYMPSFFLFELLSLKDSNRTKAADQPKLETESVFNII